MIDFGRETDGNHEICLVVRLRLVHNLTSATRSY